MRTDRGDGIQILHLAGDLDLANANDTAARGHAAITGHTWLILLDLTRLSFCDARGLSALVPFRIRWTTHVCTTVCEKATAGRACPRLDTSRLRAIWLADCAELLGLAAFMAAAGISCSQRLSDLVTGLEPAGEEQAVRLLGAARPSRDESCSKHRQPFVVETTFLVCPSQGGGHVVVPAG